MTEQVCRVTLTAGNVRHHHFYLRSCQEIVPADGIGGKNVTEIGMPFTVTFEPGETVETDVDGSKMILRNRKAVRGFFEQSAAAEGDVVVIERTDARTLQVRLEPRA